MPEIASPNSNTTRDGTLMVLRAITPIEAIEDRRELRELLDERSNQAQEFLLLWPIASCNEERSDVNVSHLAAGGKIRLMPDDYPPSIRVVSEQPPVPVSAAVNL